MTLAATNIDLERAKGWLSQRLSPERYQHSLGVHEKAVELAERFQFAPVDQERAAIAGLLHDAAKLMKPQELMDFCDANGIPLDAVDRATPQTLHPYVGAELVSREFDLSDVDTLNAIRYHTTGRVGMSPVERAVFIADKIEGNTRNPLYIQRMTEKLDYAQPWTLDLTVLTIMDSTIEFLMEKHQLLHPRTIEARNDILAGLKAANHL